MNVKIGDYVSNNFFNIFIGFLVVINVLPFLAPLLASWGWTLPSAIIYNIYSFFCHQFAWRSVHIHDFQVAWCTRDMFIWGALLFVALLAKYKNIQGIKWYWLIPFTIPIALDGGVQTVATILGFSNAQPLYMSTNFLRMITGAFFGMGIGLWMLPTLKELSDIHLKPDVSKE
ncbi:MAG: DUF2085 domain-containing protein [Candidatus Dojkabacteria bacterium]